MRAPHDSRKRPANEPALLHAPVQHAMGVRVTQPAAFVVIDGRRWYCAAPVVDDDLQPREPGCECQWEVGDAPCPVHGSREA